MTAIERTAYPTFNAKEINQKELKLFYIPTKSEIQFVSSQLRRKSPAHRLADHYKQSYLNLMVLLKSFQHLGYFPPLRMIPKAIVTYIQQHLNLQDTAALHYQHTSVLYRHQAMIRNYLQIKPYSDGGKSLAVQVATESANIHNYPADIINQVLETLSQQHYELPAFKPLDRLVRNIRHQVNQRIFKKVYTELPESIKTKFDQLLLSANRTDYNKLKELPKSTTLTHLKETIAHHDWLVSLGSISPHLKEITQIKLKHFSGEAKSLDASNLREISPEKRYTLIACLLNAAQKQVKDHLVIMFIKTMKKIEGKAIEKLSALREQNKQKTNQLLILLSDIVRTLGKKSTKKRIQSIRKKLLEQGGSEIILADCEQAIAYHSENYLPLVWQSLQSSRQALLTLLRTLDIQASTQDDLLIQAKLFLLEHAHTKKALLPLAIDISFASKSWQKLIVQKQGKKRWLIRRYFEACVLIHLADALKSTDLYVAGSASYTDFRDELLPWNECSAMVPGYCKNLHLPEQGQEAVITLRQQLTDKAKQIDQHYTEIKELVIDDNGIPILKKRPKSSETANPQIELLIKSRMPRRKLLDLLVNVNHHTGWASVFGPVSGSEPKINNAIERYILMTFAYGTGMGPTQAAQHMQHDISAHMLSWANQRHVTPAMQNKAIVKIINPYKLFDLPKYWGVGKSAAADGTLRKI